MVKKAEIIRQALSGPISKRYQHRFTTSPQRNSGYRSIDFVTGNNQNNSKNRAVNKKIKGESCYENYTNYHTIFI